MEQWKGFTTGVWDKEVNVRDFILRNYTPFTGDESFLARTYRSHIKSLETSIGIN